MDESAPACAGGGSVNESGGADLERVKAEMRAAMAAHNKAAMTQLLQQTGLPTIVINGRQFRDVLEDTITVVEGAKDLYLQKGRVVQAIMTEDGPIIEGHTEDSIRAKLSELANFVQETKESIKAVNPPRDLVRSLLSKKDLQIPELKGFIETPVFKENGNLVFREGYDQELKKIYRPGKGLESFRSQKKAGTADAELALDYVLSELLIDFPFVDECSRDNYLGLLLTPFVRQMFDGKPPLALINSPKGGTGKTLLVNIFSAITTGRRAELRVFPKKDEEFEKVLTSGLKRGAQYIAFDNVAHKLDSDGLHVALTADVITGRLLGASTDVVVPCDQIFIATGINVVLGGQIPRRCFWIDIDSKEINPETRTGFRKQNVVRWAMDNRAEIINALTTMVYAWINEGKPKWKGSTTGNFDEWARVIGGILSVAGSTQFMAKNESRKLEQNREDMEWGAFLETWHDIFADQPMTSKEVVDKIGTGDVSSLGTFTVFGSALPQDMAAAFEKETRSQFTITLGYRLRNKLNARYGEDAYELVRVPRKTKMKGSSLWAVIKNKNVESTENGAMLAKDPVDYEEFGLKYSPDIEIRDFLK